MNYNKKWQECGRKKSYYTKRDAKKALKKIPDCHLLHVYECSYCFCWHVGHMKGTKQMLKAFRDVTPLKNRNKYVRKD